MTKLGAAALLLLAACAARPPAQPEPPLQLSELPVHSLTECKAVDLASIGPADVVIAIDRSASTLDPTGFDIDHDGTKGAPIVAQRSLFEAGSTDPGDSYLAAQVVAAQSLVKAIAGGDVRVAVVAFSGDGAPASSRIGQKHKRGGIAPVYPEIIASQLTNDAASQAPTLERITASGAAGLTHFSAGMNAGIDVSNADPIADSSRRRLVLFMSENATPMMIDRHGALMRGDPALKDAALRAQGEHVVFHTFGLARNAAHEPGFLAIIADVTGGSYHPVADLTFLDCELARALMPKAGTRRRGAP